VFPHVASCIVFIIAQFVSPSTLGLWRHPSSRTLTAFFSTGWLPVLVACLSSPS
jgi:hypothetical protein